MARADSGRKKELDQLRDTLRQQGRTLEQIATAMAREFGDRPRPAWRHAHGWTQEHVADLYNREVNDPDAPMTAQRIGDFERWPLSETAAKPTVPKLGVLAKIYSTKISKLLDRHDRQRMKKDELIACAILDSGVIPQQLPGALPNFVGRTRELNFLTAQLNRPLKNLGVVVITAIGGTAGIGKTTLALHWARTHIDQFPDGQLYVDLRGFSPSGTPRTPQEAIRGFLDAFQIPPRNIPSSLDAQAALYRTLVEDKRLVIVLDNARNADQVWPLLPGSPTCLVLVTSRQQLGSLIARKQALHITLEYMTIEESGRLFTVFLGAERIQAEPQAVDELIQRCVGLPIASSIAAARIILDSHLPLSTLVGQLRKEHQRLDALSTGEDSQFTNIRAVFSWSYTALTPQAARLFRLLGLHPGADIGTLAAASLAGLSEHDTNKLLTTLIQAYLLKEHTPGRYHLHDLLRIYAAEQATKEESEPQRQAALHRVLDHYLHSGVAAARYLDPHKTLITLRALQQGTIPYRVTNHAEALEWFTAEHAVLLAAIDYAATHSFDIYAWQLPWALATFLDWTGRWHDYAATQQTAVAAASRLGDRIAQAIAYHALGHAHTQLGRYADALGYLQQALTLYQGLGDYDGQARTHLVFCLVYERQGYSSKALTHAQLAFDLYRITGNQAGQANALNYLGWNHAQLGSQQRAIRNCQQALNLFRELGDRYGEACTSDSLGYAHHRLNQHTEAIVHYQHALTLYRELGYYYDQADTLMHLGDTYHVIGNDAAARQAWRQALIVFDQFAQPDAENIRTKLAVLDTGSDEPTADDQL